MAVPAKIPHGLNFKKAVLGTINGIIDYLNSNWLQAGKGINIRRTPSGTIIELQKQPAPAPSSGGGGGMVQDLSVSVTGNTAFIGLSGSTATAQLVGTGDVEITGNTTGRIEIGVTGGSLRFPNYPAPLVAQGSVQESYTYPGTEYAAQPVWLIGNLSVEPDANGQIALSVCIYISNGGTTETVYLSDFKTQTSSCIDKVEIPVFLPISANHTFQINVMQASSANPAAGLAIYPCL